MKRSKKIMLRIIPVLMVVGIMLTTSIFAGGFGDFNENMAVEPDKNSTLVGTVNKVWGVVLTILQVAAIATIVFCGVKYMFASAENKAELKKTLPTLAVGAILVFGASTVVQFLTGAFEDITKVGQ